MLSFRNLVTEDVPLWTQTINIATKNTSKRRSHQNDEENNTEFSDRNMHGDRPETQHINQPVDHH